MRIPLEKLPPKLREQALKKLSNGKKDSKNRDPRPTPNVERYTKRTTTKADEDKADGERCCIHVHSIRKRLADPDGISAKAAIDAIVEAGILADDKAEEVKEVTYSQEKGEPEHTTITLKWTKK